MAQNKDIMFYEICRLCLDERGSCDIFDENEIIDDIYKCTGVKVSLVDHLPQKICEKCFKVVNKAKQLRIVATKNNEHLNSISFHADKQNEPSKETTDNGRVELNTGKPNDTGDKHPVIETFLKVRNDLFDSSVPEESLIPVESPEPDSTLDSSPAKIKIDRNLDNYKCEKCSKVCNNWKKYYLHKRFHIKNYACPKTACPKKFATKGDLEKHVRIHTGERPYICEFCFKGFTQRITLKKHRETVHCSDASSGLDSPEVS